MNRHDEAADDENRDPVSGEPGAHPVGTGIGAAAGGITGAGLAVGTMTAGPVGAVLGIAAGAALGGLAGKAVAEEVDPTVVHEHWRARFRDEPYHDPAMDYEDYAPAYHLGAEARRRFPDGDFDALEPVMVSGYAKLRGESRLRWEEVREAARAGWDADYRVPR